MATQFKQIDAEPNPLADLKPHQPLTRVQCGDLAAGSEVNSPLFSCTAREVSDRLYLMFGYGARTRGLVSK